MLDLLMMFLSALSMTIIGFLTQRVLGFNLNKIIADLSIVFLLVVPFIFFILSSPQGDVNALNNFLNQYITTFANALPGIIIGDIVGTFFSKMERQLNS